jgi:HSP20 family protein
MTKKKSEKRRVLVPEVQRALSPFEEMENIFEDFFRRPFFFPAMFSRMRDLEAKAAGPRVNMFEEEDALIIEAEIPGMKKEDIDVSISEDVVTITGEKKSEEKTEKKDFYYEERSIGSFTRKLCLPVETDTAKAAATFQDGILIIRIPKSPAAKEKVKKIAIK